MVNLSVKCRKMPNSKPIGRMIGKVTEYVSVTPNIATLIAYMNCSICAVQMVLRSKASGLRSAHLKRKRPQERFSATTSAALVENKPKYATRDEQSCRSSEHRCLYHEDKEVWAVGL
jgi:hypothetical protein